MSLNGALREKLKDIRRNGGLPSYNQVGSRHLHRPLLANQAASEKWDTCRCCWYPHVRILLNCLSTRKVSQLLQLPHYLTSIPQSWWELQIVDIRDDMTENDSLYIRFRPRNFLYSFKEQALNLLAHSIVLTCITRWHIEIPWPERWAGASVDSYRILAKSLSANLPFLPRISLKDKGKTRRNGFLCGCVRTRHDFACAYCSRWLWKTPFLHRMLTARSASLFKWVHSLVARRW